MVAGRYHSQVLWVIGTRFHDWIRLFGGHCAIWAHTIPFRERTQWKWINWQSANTYMCQYDGIWRGILGLQWKLLLFGSRDSLDPRGYWIDHLCALRWPPDSACMYGGLRFNWCAIPPVGNGHNVAARHCNWGVTSMRFAVWAYSYKFLADLLDALLAGY